MGESRNSTSQQRPDGAEWEHVRDAAHRLGLNTGHLRRRCGDELEANGLAKKMRSSKGQVSWYVHRSWRGPWGEFPPAPERDPILLRIEIHTSGRVVIDPIRQDQAH